MRCSPPPRAGQSPRVPPSSATSTARGRGSTWRAPSARSATRGIRTPWAALSVSCCQALGSGDDARALGLCRLALLRLLRLGRRSALGPDPQVQCGHNGFTRLVGTRRQMIVGQRLRVVKDLSTVNELEVCRALRRRLYSSCTRMRPTQSQGARQHRRWQDKRTGCAARPRPPQGAHIHHRRSGRGLFSCA